MDPPIRLRIVALPTPMKPPETIEPIKTPETTRASEIPKTANPKVVECGSDSESPKEPIHPIIEPIDPPRPIIEPIDPKASFSHHNSGSQWVPMSPPMAAASSMNSGPPPQLTGQKSSGSTGPTGSSDPNSRTSSRLMIYNQRWYYLLVPDTSVESPKRGKSRRSRSLMDDYRLSQIDGKLVVVLTTPQEKRIYSLFDSYIEFAHYQDKFLPENRCFYEVVFGEFPQKPHFDIDIDQSEIGTLDLDTLAVEIRNKVIEKVGLVFQVYGIRLQLDRDVLIYSSHGATKRSFHVIINNYCHTDHKEARKLYDKVFEAMATELQYPMLGKWVDPAVYSPKQQFRIVGSQKHQSNRPKKFEPVWNYLGQTINHRYIETPESPNHEVILQLEESLISHTSSCNVLPSLIEPNQESLTNQSNYLTDDISMDLARRALQMCAERAKISVNDRKFPYQIRSVNGGIISLKRVRASNCQLCNKVHEHENPYIFIIEHQGVKTVYFDCRRKPGQKLRIGEIVDSQATPAITPSPIMQTGIIWCANVPQKLGLIATAPDPSGKPILPPLAEQQEDPNIRSQLFLQGL